MAEFHYGRRDGDATFLLDLHPIAGGMPGGLTGLDSTGHLYGSAKQQQFFSQGGFTVRFFFNPAEKRGNSFPVKKKTDLDSPWHMILTQIVTGRQ